MSYTCIYIYGFVILQIVPALTDGILFLWGNLREESPQNNDDQDPKRILFVHVITFRQMVQDFVLQVLYSEPLGKPILIASKF